VGREITWRGKCNYSREHRLSAGEGQIEQGSGKGAKQNRKNNEVKNALSRMSGGDKRGGDVRQKLAK